jgi:hypothetical protein
MMLMIKPLILKRRLHGHVVDVQRVEYEIGKDGKSLVRNEKIE